MDHQAAAATRMNDGICNHCILAALSLCIQCCNILQYPVKTHSRTARIPLQISRVSTILDNRSFLKLEVLDCASTVSGAARFVPLFHLQQ
jgi:hypothetical protein